MVMITNTSIRMAVMLTTEDGCVLDHRAAIAAAYRKCNLPASSLKLAQSNFHEIERTVIEHSHSVSRSAMPEPVVGVSVHTKYVSTDDSEQTVDRRSVSTPEHSLTLPCETAKKLVRLSCNVNTGHTGNDTGGSTDVLQVVPVCPSITCFEDPTDTGCSERQSCETAAHPCILACPSLDPQQLQTNHYDNHYSENGETAISLCHGEITACKTDQNVSICAQNKTSTSLCMSSDGDQPVTSISVRKLSWNSDSHSCLVSESNTRIKESSGQTGEVPAMFNDVSVVSLAANSRRSVSFALKHGFFAVKVPYMMDSQFEKVDKHFAHVASANSNPVSKISVTDIQQILSTKRKRKKTETRFQDSEEDNLHKMYLSLTHTARERGIFLQHIPLPLDNNLLSRKLAQLDHHSDVFTELLVNEDGQPILHMGDCVEALEINLDSCTVFSAPSLIHRKVSHPSKEASVVSVEGMNYVLPSCCHFLLSNLEDFCDHLHLNLDENVYDLIVLDPPWENKSVKRKRSYNTLSEDELLDLPVTRLGKPGSLVALWVTNNDRLEDYAQNTLFPAWEIHTVARWHWVKATQTGHLISSMEVGHKKPYEILLLGRRFSDSVMVSVEKEELPAAKVIVSVPCSLHSKKPPLEEVLHPYLPPNPQCLELFARNLWPGWTSWGREALKHQNLMFYEEVKSLSPTLRQ